MWESVVDLAAAMTIWGAVPLVIALTRGHAATRPPANPDLEMKDLWWVLPAVAGMIVAAALTLALPPFTFDDWLYLGLGQRLADGTLQHWLSAFTAHVHPDEPTVRPLTYWMLGGSAALASDAWWGWRLITLLMHTGAAAVLWQLAAGLTGSRRAGLLAALIWWIHPAQVEVLGWLANNESALAALLYFSAALAWSRERTLLAAFLMALTIATRESGTTLLGAFALLDLLKHQRIRWRALIAPVLVAAASFWWRAALAEPENLRMAAYLADMTGAGPMAFVEALAVAVPRIVLQPFEAGVVPGSDLLLLLACIATLGLVWHAAKTSRSDTLRWALFGAAWLVGIVLPSAWDVDTAHLAASELTRSGHGASDLAPPWKLRHLYVALAGPAITGGWLITRFALLKHQRMVATGLLAASAALLVGATGPIVSTGERVAAVADALDTAQLPENVALRVVQASDPLATLVLYRRIMTPAARTTALLVGEPRCGCAIEALGPSADRTLPGDTLRGFADWMVPPSRVRPIAPGKPCSCRRWRPDARFVVWRDGRLVPD